MRIIHWAHDSPVARFAVTTADRPPVRRTALPAHMIVDVTQVHDEARHARYREAVPASIAAAGRRYLARGGGVRDPIAGPDVPRSGAV